MPELPEVETVRRGLAPAMEGATIAGVEQRRGDLRFPFPYRFAERLTGRRVLSVDRRAKFLLFRLDADPVLIAHLGMSGSFRIERETLAEAVAADAFHHARSKLAQHDHAVLHLTRAGTATRIVYNDPRRFGFMHFADADALATDPFLAGLGIEPTGNALSGPLLRQLFSGRRAPLKAALLDQRLIAGLGNIYVCEALWRAKLSPRRTAGSVGPERGARLAAAIRDVLAEAIAAGGSTLRDHRTAEGELGYFQHAFDVYGREGQPCRRGGCGGTVARIVQSGRSTFYCPHCQR